MIPEVIWTARAEGDLLREFSRLEDIRDGLGAKFLDIVDSAIRLLRVNPEMAPRYSDNYRRLVVRDRMLGIYYSFEPRGVIVHAICDLRQDRDTIIQHLNK